MLAVRVSQVVGISCVGCLGGSLSGSVCVEFAVRPSARLCVLVVAVGRSCGGVQLFACLRVSDVGSSCRCGVVGRSCGCVRCVGRSCGCAFSFFGWRVLWVYVAIGSL